jgi:pimeloyl-ACP methyl ester carboxylesterase
MAFVETRDGTKLFVKDWGSGPPVVLIHGWPVNADMWEYQMPYLASQGLRTVAYDRRGFGRSDQPWSGYDYDTFADDLSSVLDHLSLEQVTLVGFSMGGGEIARFLSRHGKGRIAKAVLVSAVTPYLLKTPDNDTGAPVSVFNDMIEGLSKDRPAFLANFGKAFFGVNAGNDAVSSETLQWQHNLAMMASPKATIDCVRAFGETDFRRDMAAFTVPTLIIHGDKDQTVPIEASGRIAHRMIPNSRLEVYEGAPHGLFVTEKDRLNADLLRFIRT